MGLIRRAGRFGWKLLISSLLVGIAAGSSLPQEPAVKRSPALKAPSKSETKKAPDTFTLVGAGDIVGCSDLSAAEATAKLIDAIPGTVFAAGDLAYQRGTYEEFVKCYGPTWGRFKARTHPTPGNHEYDGATATGYFRYWDGRAGDPGKGYYSYDLGSWHIVVLNTNCSSSQLRGCAEGSPEETWLKQGPCRTSKRLHTCLWPSRSLQQRPLPETRRASRASRFLAGSLRRPRRPRPRRTRAFLRTLRPQNPGGNPDPDHGIREIVVGNRRPQPHPRLATPNPTAKSATTKLMAS